MARSTTDIKKHQKRNKPRGRPRTGIGIGVLVRLSKDELAHLDEWIAKQEEGLGVKLSRPAAIRARLNTLK